MSTFPTFFSNQYYLNLVTQLYQTQLVQVTGTLRVGDVVIENILPNTTGIKAGALVIGEGIPTGVTVIALGSNALAISEGATDGYGATIFTFDSPVEGFDLGRWSVYSGTTELSFFSGPSPKMFAWLLANLQLGQDLALCMQSFQAAFNLFGTTGQQAVGTQLDIIGNLLGQSRNVPVLSASIVSGGSGYVVSDVITIYQAYGGGVQMTYRVTSIGAGGIVTGLLMLTPGFGYFIGDATTTGGTGTGLTVGLGLLTLSDDDYRVLLKCTVMKNHWNGQVSNIPNICVVTPGVNYVVGDVINVLQNQASGMLLLVSSVSGVGGVTGLTLQNAGSSYQIGGCTTTGGSGSGLTVYLPQAGISLSNEQIGTIQQLWQLIFGESGGVITIEDGGATVSFDGSTVMTATVYVSFGPFTSTSISALAVNGYLIPRPQGVLYNYTIALTPVLGYDQNNALIAGFDTGYFA